MASINKLKEVKNKAKLLLLLSTLGIGTIYPKINVEAKNNTYFEENLEEENTTTTNKYSHPETMSDYITYYSNVYGIKEELIYDRLDYMYNENSDNEEFINMDTELKVLTITRNIKNDPNIDSSIKYTGKTYEVSLEPEELIEKYCELFGVKKEIALSIAYSECAWPISSDWNYNTNGNLAGICTDKYLGNKEEGVITTILIFRDDYNINTETDSDIFASISKRYCPPNWEVWQSRAKNYYDELIENGFYSNAPEELQNKHKNDSKTLSLKDDD